MPIPARMSRPPAQSRLHRRIVRTLLLAPTVAFPLGAQPDPYRVTELAPGVLAVVRKVLTNGVSDSNVLVVINDDDVVVVDANIFPSSAREVIAEIRKRTSKPVRYVVNTHFHSDHHYGNAEYRNAFPGVEFISHPRTRERILSEDIPSLKKNVEVEYPAIIARYEKALATGKRSDGTDVSTNDRKRMAELLEVYRFFLRDVQTMQQVPATITVADSLVLLRGERSIVVKWLGRGNTEGDLVVHLPRERVVATGDLVVSPVPFGFGSFPGDWATTLRALKGLGVTGIMPGHGEIMTEWSYVDRLIPMLDSVAIQVKRSVAAGADLAATRKAVNFEPFRNLFAGSDPRLREGFDRNFATPIVESAFEHEKRAAASDTSRVEGGPPGRGAIRR